MKLWLSFLILLTVAPLLFAQQIRQINICALRVEFEEDNSDLTTGNGLFMIDTTTTDRFAIDPAPHNRLYFQDQLQAAANYYTAVSHGRVQVSGDVYPLSDTGAFSLPHQMGYYSPNTTQEEIDLGLANLFRDALDAAKNSSETIDFSAYDLFVIFHAGVGKDIDLGYDNTPQDISSLFITPQFLKAAFGDSFTGVDLNGTVVDRGIILPETENQEGLQIALTGMFVSNIGSYLELRDLFSPSDQSTGIGRFGLMDMGLMNMNGLIPSPPGAYSRMLLGWDQVAEISEPTNNIRVKRLSSDAETAVPTIIKIPINADEYYLIEYRGDSAVNLDSLYSVLASGRDDVPSYLELLETYYGNRIQRGASGVLVQVPDYDWGIPGSGLLIWHVDEARIAAAGNGGSINDDPEVRAVDIEEADGAQDIGHPLTILDYGYYDNINAGWFADFWYRGNPAFDDQRALEFSTSSVPNTRANRNHANTHIKIHNFSNNLSDEMHFDFTRDWYEPGFPFTISGGEVVPGEPVAGIPEGAQNAVFFICDASGAVHMVHKDSPISGAPTTIFAKLPAVAKLALGDRNGNGQYDILYAATADSLYGFEVGSGGLGAFRTRVFQSPIVTAPVAAMDKVFVGTADGSLFVFTNDTLRQILNQPAGSNTILIDAGQAPILLPQAADYAVAWPISAGVTNLVSFGASSLRYELPDGGDPNYWTQTISWQGAPAVADIDGNGNYDILGLQSDGLYAFNYLGYSLNNFPILPRLDSADHLIGSPLVIDADADGQLDLVFASYLGTIFGYSLDGQLLDGFPLSCGGTLNSGPQLQPFDTDEAPELLVVNQAGTVYSWQLPYSTASAEPLWIAPGNGPENNLFQKAMLQQVHIGNTLMPAKRVYNYPNPNAENFTTIRYYLNEAAQVKIRIFDSAGKPVTSFSGPGAAGIDNEIRWQVEDIASGVYLCRIEAKSSTAKASKIIKIMVVH